MGRAFEAAAKCAARQGAETATRESLIALGRGLAHAEAAGIGHVLGLTAAIPLGITFTPMLAQHARRQRGLDAGFTDTEEYEPGQGVPFSDVATESPDMGGDFADEILPPKRGFEPPDAPPPLAEGHLDQEQAQLYRGRQ